MPSSEPCDTSGRRTDVLVRGMYIHENNVQLYGNGVMLDGLHARKEACDEFRKKAAGQQMKRNTCASVCLIFRSLPCVTLLLSSEVV